MPHSPKVAVVGSGYWGKNLVRNYSALGALACVCDINTETLGRFAEQYPGLTTCSDYGAMLANPEVDGVVIATPAETHYSLALAALNAGKHVYVEKPLVLDEAAGRKLIRLAEDKGLTLMVGHLLQYHPVFIKLRELVAAGEFGRINYIYSHRLNLGKIRREENILWSFAPHDISMILSLAGESPEEVTAVGGYYLHEAIADVTTTHMSFASGLKAHIFVSWLHPFKEQKLVVVGEKLMGVFDDTLPWADKLLLYPHEINWSNGMPVPTKVEPRRVAVDQDEPLRSECQHFLHCMHSGERPRTDGEEGLRVLDVLTRAQKSLDASRAAPVSPAAPVAPAAPLSPVAPVAPVAPQAAAAPAYSAHETALIDAGVQIGEGSKIWHYSHILSGSIIGKNVSIGQNASIGPDVSIGDGCKIQNNISVYKGVTLEEDVFCGPSMVFTNVHNPRAHIRRMSEARTTLVRRGATLGANCTIVCGVTIGRYAFVGAGAVVTKDVPDHALVVGNPARPIGWMCQCGHRMAEARCPDCGKSLADVDGGK